MFAVFPKGIDLSTSYLAGMVAVMVASLVQPADLATRLFPGRSQLPTAVALLLGIGIGAIVAYTKIHPFIATLGAQLICRAVAKMYSNKPVSNLSEGFRVIVRYKLFGLLPISSGKTVNRSKQSFTRVSAGPIPKYPCDEHAIFC